MRTTFRIRVAAVLGWAGLAACWWLVVRDGDAPTPAMVAAPLVLALVTMLVTGWWIRHNLAIHRRKGPRRKVPVAPSAYLADRRGRPLVFEPALVRTARHVVVEVTADGAKRYRVVS